MFLQLYGSDKHINQSILAGRQEQSGPWSHHQSFFLAQKTIPTGAWQSIISLLVFNCFLQWSLHSVVKLGHHRNTSTHYPIKVAENWQGRNKAHAPSLLRYHHHHHHHHHLTFLSLHVPSQWSDLGMCGHLVRFQVHDLVIGETPPACFSLLNFLKKLKFAFLFHKNF